MFEDDSLESSVSSKMEETDAKPSSDLSRGKTMVSNLPTPSVVAGMQHMSLRPYLPQAPGLSDPQHTGTLVQQVGSTQFGQPPVSLPVDMQQHQQQPQQTALQVQQLPLSSQRPRPSQPPPYPGVVTTRPPPPYQVMTNLRSQMHPRSFGGKPLMTLSGQSGVMISGQGQAASNSQSRPTHVPEQRLLLEDLLEQEKQEQRRQQQQHGLLGPQLGEDNLLSDIDFEKLKADFLSTAGPSVSMSPPGPSVPSQGILPLHSPLSGSPSVKVASPGQVSVHSPGMSMNNQDTQVTMGFPVRSLHQTQCVVGQGLPTGIRAVAPQDGAVHPGWFCIFVI